MSKTNTVSTVPVSMHGSHSSTTTSKDSRIATTPTSGLPREPDPTNSTTESGPGIVMNGRTLAAFWDVAGATAGTVDDHSIELDDVRRLIAHGFPDLAREELPLDDRTTRIDLVLVTARENLNEHKLLPHETVFI